MMMPHGPTVLEVGDEVLVVADKVGAEQVAELFTIDNHES
jgi:Trk K+ transport system NAD-binding subunit